MTSDWSLSDHFWYIRKRIEYRLRAIACKLRGHDWSPWHSLCHGPGGRFMQYRTCERCGEPVEWRIPTNPLARIPLTEREP